MVGAVSDSQHAAVTDEHLMREHDHLSSDIFTGYAVLHMENRKGLICLIKIHHNI